MLDKIIEERKMPEVWDGKGSWDKRREEIKELLMREEYGIVPPDPTDLTFEVLDEHPNKINTFCAGRASIRKMLCKGKVYGREFSFPFF